MNLTSLRIKRRQILGFCRGLFLSLAIRMSLALIFFIKTAKINDFNENIRLTKTTFIFGKCRPDVILRMSLALIFFIKTAKINDFNENIRLTKTTFIFGKCRPDVWPGSKTDPDVLSSFNYPK